MSISWVQGAVSYIVASRHRIFPFLVVGGSAFIINWGLFKLFRVVGLSTPFLVNLALILSIEISILYNFIFQYLWTWKDSSRLRGRALFFECLTFHGAVGVGVIARLILFPIGQVFNLQDDLNFVIGVAVATIFDFVLYDKVVFRQRLPSLRQEAPGDRATLTP